jgi:threonine aldolase
LNKPQLLAPDEIFIRLVTSFATDPESIQSFIDAAREAMS